MHVSTFIRNNKQTPIDQMLVKLKAYDPSIKSSSIHIALYQIFKSKYNRLNEKHLIELLKFINSQFGKLPPTSNVETNMSKIRKILKDKYGYDSTQYQKSREHLVFDKQQKAINIAAYTNKVFERNSNCKSIKISLINSLMKYSKSENWKEKFIYLLLNSGSRSEEIFTGKFKKGDGGNILLSNIAKTRDKEREISKPLLDKDSSHFLKVLGEVRALNLKPKSSNTILNALLKSKIGENLYFLRKAYANLSYHLINDKSISKTVYLSRILGHDVDNEKTALSYQNYYIVEDEPLTQSKLPSS